MAKTAEAKKPKETKPTVVETTSIILAVPNALYDEVRGKAQVETRKANKKCTIHDQMIEDLYKANPNVKKPKK